MLSLLSAVAFLATTVIAQADSNSVCAYLNSKYPQLVAFDPLNPQAGISVRNAAAWTKSNTEYWDRRNLSNRATCAFFAENAQQVADAVQQLNRFPGTAFAIKSGGHQFNKGFSSVDKGLLISFNENLASTVRSADGNSFVVGSGARWGDVYEVTGRTNQVVVGGRLANIGVGGFILGGGLSYYSAQYGLACDNVINFEVVLANGTIANANKNENTDLYWALKGGGNRFAIVTRFTLQAHPAGIDGQVWGGIRVYPATERSKVFDALAKYVRDYPDAKSAIIPTHNYAIGVLPVILVFFFYDGPTPPAGLFADFDRITALSSTTQTRTYLSMSQEAGGAALRGFGAAARVTSFQNLEPANMTRFYEGHFDIYAKRAILNTIPGLAIDVLTFTPQPISRRIAAASNAQGPNALGLNPANGDRIWIENNVVYLNPVCDLVCPDFLKGTVDLVEAFHDREFRGIPPTNYRDGDINFVSRNPLFMNDAGADQNVYGSYGAANEARLREVQRRYDPQGLLFRQGGFRFF